MVRIPLFLSSLESGSVRPLIYGKTAKPLSEFEGSAHLKNIPTNSSEDGVIFFCRLKKIAIPRYSR